MKKKITAIIICITLILSCFIPASAANNRKPSLNATSKQLFLEDISEKYSTTFDFNVKNLLKNYFYCKWHAEKPDIIKVNSTTGLTKALNKVGISLLYCDMIDKKTKKIVKTFTATVRVRNVVKKVYISNAPANNQILVGTEFDFDRQLETLGEGPSNVITRWFLDCDNSVATIATGGVLKALKAGKVTITAKTFVNQDDYDNGKFTAQSEPYTFEIVDKIKEDVTDKQLVPANINISVDSLSEGEKLGRDSIKFNVNALQNGNYVTIENPPFEYGARWYKGTSMDEKNEIIDEEVVLKGSEKYTLAVNIYPFLENSFDASKINIYINEQKVSATKTDEGSYMCSYVFEVPKKIEIAESSGNTDILVSSNGIIEAYSSTIDTGLSDLSNLGQKYFNATVTANGGSVDVFGLAGETVYNSNGEIVDQRTLTVISGTESTPKNLNINVSSISRFSDVILSGVGQVTLVGSERSIGTVHNLTLEESNLKLSHGGDSVFFLSGANIGCVFDIEDGVKLGNDENGSDFSLLESDSLLKIGALSDGSGEITATLYAVGAEVHVNPDSEKYIGAINGDGVTVKKKIADNGDIIYYADNASAKVVPTSNESVTSPKTGDNLSIIACAILISISGVSVFTLIASRKKRK